MQRQIKPEMIEFIDHKIENDDSAQFAITTRNARRLLVQVALSCVGIREEGGNNKGPLVELMQRTLGGADREPWCASAVQTWIAYVEHKLNIKSDIYPSEHCLTIWNNTPESSRVRFSPLPGSVIIWRHGNSMSGHTGLLEKLDGNIIYAIEGNTEKGIDPNGKVERDGGGVYKTVRSTKGDGNMKIVGFLKPFEWVC